MRKTRLALALVGSLALLGCRPLEVRADPAGSQKLPLPGALQVEGTVTRALSYNGVVVPKGARVRVEETWLLRHDKSAKPPGYRITGLYDTTTQTDGLALPKHAVDTYYVSVVLPGGKQRVPVPAAHFERQ